MTIHLTMLTPPYILQVSDRRITRSDTGEAHPLANKNVVFLARDGIFTIGYSGIAYLEGVPTDTWIACKLADEDHRPFRDGKRRGMRVGELSTRPWPDIGQAVELLTRETEKAFARLHPNLIMRHQIMIAGWQSHRRRVRPAVYLIENSDEELLSFTKDSAERYEHYDRDRSARLMAIPDDVFSSAEIEQFKLKETYWPPENCMKTLVRIVRYVAARNDGVGPDCMAVLLPNPNHERRCYFAYEPVTEGRASFGSAGPDAGLPAAFSPWLVGPNLHAPPAILVGGNVHFPPLGDYEVVGYTPPVNGSATTSKKGGYRMLGGLSTQKRPRDPSQRRRTDPS